MGVVTPCRLGNEHLGLWLANTWPRGGANCDGAGNDLATVVNQDQAVGVLVRQRRFRTSYLAESLTRGVR